VVPTVRTGSGSDRGLLIWDVGFRIADVVLVTQ
jgi:hypothetical protein